MNIHILTNRGKVVFMVRFAYQQKLEMKEFETWRAALDFCENKLSVNYRHFAEIYAVHLPAEYQMLDPVYVLKAKVYA